MSVCICEAMCLSVSSFTVACVPVCTVVLCVWLIHALNTVYAMLIFATSSLCISLTPFFDFYLLSQGKEEQYCASRHSDVTGLCSWCGCLLDSSHC